MRTGNVMKRIALCAALVLTCIASPALASPVPLESGTVSFSGPPALDGSGHHLDGTVSFWVYSPNTFPYPNSDGYTPTPNEYVYVYQIHENSAPTTNLYYDQNGIAHIYNFTGVSPVSALGVNLSTPAADTLGQFTDPAIGGPGLSPADLSQSLLDNTSSAYWFFTNLIQSGDTSYGLAFSSPYSPILGSFGLNDDGTSAGTNAAPINLPLVPVPGNVNTPEPTTIVMLLLGALCVMPASIRRWRSR
jgi:hypothetical protein